MRVRIPSWPALVTLLGCGAPEAPQVHIEPSGPTSAMDLRALPVPGDDEVWSWHWFREGQEQAELRGPTVSASHTTRGETWRVEVRTHQGRRASAAGEASTTIGNAPPTILARLSPDPPRGGEPLQAVVETSDDDDDEVTFESAWSIDGVPQSGLRDQLPADEVLVGRLIELVVTATDGTATATATATATVGNRAPLLAQAVITPSPATRDQSLAVDWAAADPDGDEVQASIEWFVDGLSVHVGATLDPTLFARDQQVHATLRPTDGVEEGAPRDTEPVIVANALPTVQQVDVLPSVLTAWDTAVCTPTGPADADGDMVAPVAQWWVNGAPAASGLFLEGGVAFTHGDVVACEVVPSDGLDDGPLVASAPVVVADGLPSPPQAALFPADAHADESLRCDLVVPSVDPDGDPVDYRVEWLVDGQPWTGPVETHTLPGDTIPWGQLGFGQTWACALATSQPDATPVFAPANARTVPMPPGGNVLLVVFDDVGIDKFSAYTAQPNQPTLPVMDSLFAQGVRFTNAYSYPNCSPTRSSMLTGRHASRTGMGTTSDSKDNWYNLPQAEVSLPEALVKSPSGWTTALFGKWHLNHAIDGDWPDFVFAQGFDHFSGMSSNLGWTTVFAVPPASGDTGAPVLYDYFEFEKYEDGVLVLETTYATTDVVDDAVALIPTLPEPWFAQVSFNAPHSPYHHPPDELVHTQAPAVDAEAWEYHNAMMEAADTELGRLLSTLDPTLLANTTLIVLGDNGSPKATIIAPFDEDKGKNTLFEGGIHIPMVVTGPLVTQPGTTSDALVHTVDIFATVAEIAGVRTGQLDFLDGITPGYEGLPDTNDTSASATGDTGPTRVRPTGAVAIDGRTLLPFVQDSGSVNRRTVIYDERFSPNGRPPHAKFHQRTVYDGQYKYLKSTTDEFWDLTTWLPDEGQGLISSGAVLTPDQQAAHTRLSGILAEKELEILFEY